MTHDARNLELEQAIRSSPDNDDAYIALGVWLRDQGDVRGELNALQCAGDTRAAAKLLDENAAYFLGPLSHHKEAFRWRGGFIESISLYGYGSSGWPALIDDTLGHPSGRFLTTIRLNFDDASQYLQPVLDLLARRKPTTLLSIAIFEPHDFGRFEGLWPSVPNLRELVIDGGRHDLGSQIQLPELRRGTFRIGAGLRKANLKAITRATWPNLEFLEIWVDEDSTINEIEPLLARRDLEKLVHLGLRNAGFADEVIERMVNSSILKQLRHLDLSMGVLSDEGALLIARNRAEFQHLDVLDVSQSYLSKAGILALEGAAKSVITAEQREVDETYYRRPVLTKLRD